MRRSNRWPFAIVSGLVFLVAAFWLLTGSAIDYPKVALGRLIPVGTGCAALYLISHVVRAVRLAIIGVSIHKASFRTLALLNLSVAPWSMIAPFKLDEIIRINELRSVDGSLVRAVMTLIIDRSMDGPMFVIFALILGLAGSPDIAMFAGFFGIGMIAVTAGFFAASKILEYGQRYIFLYHYKPRALYTLRIVDQMRKLCALGRETITNTAPMLLVCTVFIWLIEISAVALMLWVFAPESASLSSAVSAALVRANSGWQAILFGRPLGFPAATITTFFTIGLLLIWPFAIWFYCRRRLSEVRNAEFLNRNWGVSAT